MLLPPRDQDIAQVEGLAGPDGELLSDLVSLLRIRPVEEAVQGTGDQGGQGDAALSVREGALLHTVVLRVHGAQERDVGRQLAPDFPISAEFGCGRRGDEL